MVRELSALGAQVTVYGSDQGPGWVNLNEFDPSESCDVLVMWRNVAPLTRGRPAGAKRVVLWLHDLGLPTLPPPFANAIDEVFVLSNFHRRAIQANNQLLRDKFWLARNGIDVARYDAPLAKEPFKFFYSSSPRRGLGRLLNDWPAVRKAYPGAELHVAYGFDLSIQMCERTQNFNEAAIFRMLLKKAGETEGVIHHHRLAQKDLASLQSSCVAWLYPPSDFEETFCITALEAMAARAIPISRSNGALPEVLKHQKVWEPGVSTVRVLDTLSDTNWPLKLDENEAWGRGFTWAHEAQRWLEHFDAR